MHTVYGVFVTGDEPRFVVKGGVVPPQSISEVPRENPLAGEGGRAAIGLWRAIIGLV